MHKQIGSMTKFGVIMNGIPREETVSGMKAAGEFGDEFHEAKLRMEQGQEI